MIYRPKTVSHLSSITEEIVSLHNGLKSGFRVEIDSVDAWVYNQVLYLGELEQKKMEEEMKKNNRGKR